MTPEARISAAIEVLDRVLEGQPAEQSLLRWSRASRFAGSGDRAAVRDLVFDALRRRNSLAAAGGALTGRGLMIGLIRLDGRDPAQVFTGQGHAPAPLTEAEAVGADDTAAVDLPHWLLPLWRGALGDDADLMAQMMTERAPVWLRVNPRRGDRQQAIASLAADGIDAVADDRLQTALKVTANERRLSQSTAYRDGLVELQDLSPQLACAALPLSPGQRVLDYCAGGGGKALALASRMQPLRMTAHDADPARMADLPARAKRAGVKIEVATGVTGAFDLVVTDVPCSGSGTWRRTPDQKWRLTRAKLDEVIAVQADILRKAAPHVRPGGHLAYMTCSVFEEENGAQIDRFLQQSGFTETLRQRWTPIDASDGFFLSLSRRDG
ncbi:RsmB/NOP family class I SAM-dependent RNA methyltransferase [Paracoccus caeni]|uniref:RsmB/NOP family class I SAM-dependent RNA methyltransferase n=1 Tax=Paracoccus caeni TaxID=657651 RepID=A0A934VU51_9RHOB|nr:RsmB/NOP family class I SAM-dependent RNA methyltransferase [Paracoccus caeni]MBK4215446.1 RsmB/NOP family class I SAM-dependent RNA methyltransferase [Paracoccus caeni]